jgi:hypothetical protein
MKFIFLLFLIVQSLSGFSQNLTYKDIIGKWSVQYSETTASKYNITFLFSDTAHIDWSIDGEKMPTMFYKIENEIDSCTLIINTTGDYSIYHSGEVHRVTLNSDTLRIYNFYFPLVSNSQPKSLILVRSKN